MKRLPSTSNRCAPSPQAIKIGSPPTARNARTGELTPPGISFCAFSNRAFDLGRFMKVSAGSPAADAGGDLPQGDTQLPPQPALESLVGLPAGDEVLHQIFESLAAPAKLDHARGDGIEEKPASVKNSREPCAQLQIVHHLPPQAAGVVGDASLDYAVGQQVAGPQREKNPFAGDGVGEPGRITHGRPTAAGDAVALEA